MEKKKKKTNDTNTTTMKQHMKNVINIFKKYLFINQNDKCFCKKTLNTLTKITTKKYLKKLMQNIH
jgi:hypothetical protein